METLPTKQNTSKALSPLFKADPFKFSVPVRTINDVLELPSEEKPCLNALKRTDEKRYGAIVRLALVKLDKDLKCKVNLTEGEIELIVDEMEEKYGGLLTFADLAVICRNAVLGKYGELYEKITAAKVLGWIDQYADERQTAAYEQNRKRDNETYGIERKPRVFPVYEAPEKQNNIVEDNKHKILAEILQKPENERTEIEKIYLQVTSY